MVKTLTIVSHYDVNDNAAAAVRLARTKSYFQDKNWKVNLVVAPTQRVNASKLSKLFFTLTSIRKLFLTAFGLRKSTDVYFVSTPPMYLLVVAFLLQRFSFKPVILEQRDLLSINPLTGLKWLRQNFISQSFEKSVLKRASRVVVVTEKMKEDVKEFLPNLQSIIVVRNGFWKNDYSSILKTMNSNGPLKITYIGNFYGSRNPTPLIEALLEVTNPDVDIEFYGLMDNQSLKTDLEKKISQKGMANKVKFLNPVSRQSALEKAVNSDVLLLVTHDKGSENAIPAKLFEYVALAKPILAISSDPMVVEPINSYKLGWCFRHDQISEIRNHLSWMIENAAELRAMELPGLNLEDLNAEKQLNILYEAARYSALQKPFLPETNEYCRNAQRGGN